MSQELGHMLVKAGKITPDQLAQALEQQKASSEKFADILVRMGAVGDEDELTHFIGRQLTSELCVSPMSN
jgi:hypothetical protein